MLIERNERNTMAIYKYKLTAEEIPVKLATLNTDGRLNRRIWDYESFDETIKHDLDRLPLVYFGDDEAQIRERLKNIDHFSNEDETEFNYNQYDLQGGLATTIAINKKMEKKEYENNKSINFAYLNDQNQLCNFDLTYIKDQTNQSHLIIAITENINGELHDRNTTLLIDDFYFPEESETLKNQGEIVTAENIPTSIEASLKSTQVNQLIAPMINNKGFNEKQFKPLDSRILIGKNIDDRTHKTKQLDELIELAKLINKDLPESDYVTDLIKEINKDKEGINRFKEASFEKLMLRHAIHLELRINLLHANPDKRKQLKLLNSLLYTRHQLERQLRRESKNPEVIEAIIACINDESTDFEYKEITVQAAPGEETLEEMYKTYRQPFTTRHKGSLIFGSIAATGALALGITGAVLVATGVLAPFGVPLLIGAAVFGALALAVGGAFVNVFVKETKLVAAINNRTAETFKNNTALRVNEMIPEEKIQEKMKQLEAQKPALEFRVAFPLPNPEQDERPDALLKGYTDAALHISEGAVSLKIVPIGIDGDEEDVNQKPVDLKHDQNKTPNLILSPIDLTIK